MTREPIRLFISYARKDRDFMDDFRTHLNPLERDGIIRIWADPKLETGVPWDPQIIEQLEASEIIVLLISPHAVSSEYIWDNELRIALERQGRREARLLPVVIRNVELPELISSLQVLCSDQPIAACADQDSAWKKVVQEVKRVVASFETPNPVLQPSKNTKAVDRNRLKEKTQSPAIFGRNSLVKLVCSEIESQEVRVLTLTGPPGVGKTRCSREVARVLTANGKSCAYVELSEAKTLTGICYAIHEAFGESLQSENAAEATSRLIANATVDVVILDNFEQVAEFAGVSIGKWIDEIDGVQFIVTSRRSLRLGLAEKTVSVRPLSIPKEKDTEAAARTSSVRMLLERANDRRSLVDMTTAEQTAVIRICQLLDGLPLAIQIAAARITLAHYSYAEALQRLQQNSDFLQGYNRALSWSYRDLRSNSQMVFNQCCRFFGGFTREDVYSCCHNADGRISEMELDVCLGDLIESQLIHKKEGDSDRTRFDLLVPIREFGRALWEEEVGTEFRQRFFSRASEHFIAKANALTERISSTVNCEVLELLADEMENVFEIQDEALKSYNQPLTAARAILSYSEALARRGPMPMRSYRLSLSLEALDGTTDVNLRLRLLLELASAYWFEGNWDEGATLIDRAVAYAVESDVDEDLRILAHIRQGDFRKDRGFFRRALAAYEVARSALLRRAPGRDMAQLLIGIGGTLDRVGEPDASLRSITEAEGICRKIDDVALRALSCNRRGITLWHWGRCREAINAFEEAMELHASLGISTWKGAHLTNIGLALTDLGRLDEALQAFEEGLAIQKANKQRAWWAVNIAGTGCCYLARGLNVDLERAVELLTDAEELFRDVYYPENVAMCRGARGRAYLRLNRLDEAAYDLRRTVAIDNSLQIVREPRHLHHLVDLAEVETQKGSVLRAREATLRAHHLAERLKIESFLEVPSALALMSRIKRLRQIHIGEPPAVSSLVDLESDAVRKRRIELTLTLKPIEATQVLKSMEEQSSQMSYEFPWMGIENDVGRESTDTFPLLALGSLMNPAIYSELLEGDIQTRPVVAFGITRTLERDMESIPQVRLSSPPSFNQRGLVNSRYSGSLFDRANGILIDCPASVFADLRKRQIGYDLRPVLVAEWNEELSLSWAWFFASPDRVVQSQRLVNEKLEPHPDYLQVCLAGARAISEEFEEFFVHTTFLADNQTLLAAGRT